MITRTRKLLYGCTLASALATCALGFCTGAAYEAKTRDLRILGLLLGAFSLLEFIWFTILTAYRKTEPLKQDPFTRPNIHMYSYFGPIIPWIALGIAIFARRASKCPSGGSSSMHAKTQCDLSAAAGSFSIVSAALSGALAVTIRMHTPKSTPVAHNVQNIQTNRRVKLFLELRVALYSLAFVAMFIIAVVGLYILKFSSSEDIGVLAATDIYQFRVGVASAVLCWYIAVLLNYNFGSVNDTQQSSILSNAWVHFVSFIILFWFYLVSGIWILHKETFSCAAISIGENWLRCPISAACGSACIVAALLTGSCAVSILLSGTNLFRNVTIRTAVEPDYAGGIALSGRRGSIISY